MSRHSFRYFILCMLLSSVQLFSHSQEEHEENFVYLTIDQIKQLGIRIKKAEAGTLFLSISTPGKIILQPDQLAHIVPKVSGITREASYNLGHLVKRGDIMATLESSDMADYKATFLAALSREKLAQSILKREKKLFQEKVSSEQDYLNAKNGYEESFINLQLVKQKLQAFGLLSSEIEELAVQNDPNLRLYSIRSPIDGTVIMRHITIGEFIENTNIIYEVADLSKVWVEIGIYPKDLYKVKAGQSVVVTIPSENKLAQARLIYVSPIVADETIAAKAIAELDNQTGDWRPGVFVKALIETDQLSCPLVVSNDAIQMIDDQPILFVGSKNEFEKRVVQLGQSDGKNTEILSGLKPGESYVVNKTFLLKAELGKNSAEHED
ncbi:Uncharacterized protein PRO82_001729 [Candidatus Protochlamydia amoebophila]|uniref:efflux RND transporter periplasmic adaptor subunit n=1 Tax=Candidatus Protochlamydia amoebophila TaxID=362787 RepID=UPI001BC8E4A4|nr:efflux RND transporter periplasmic adaptor subunit [Candidatus Protochlamydia amoebophila]MBS4164401.1 Uncharacterized protein [Candidatus Protochlamydia amoebophila]